MHIAEQEIICPSESGNFDVMLPSDANIQSAYHRDGRFYFLYKSDAFNNPVTRRFFVFWCNSDKENVINLSGLVGSYRYVGGDRFEVGLIQTSTTIHFFEILPIAITS